MEPQTLEHIEGTIEDIVYHNEETTFTVLEVSVEEELVTDRKSTRLNSSHMA